MPFEAKSCAMTSYDDGGRFIGVITIIKINNYE